MSHEAFGGEKRVLRGGKSSGDGTGWWRRGYAVAAGVLLMLLAASVAFSNLTATTRRGVNARVSVHEGPLLVKVIDFLHRHYQYDATAREITGDLQFERERVLAIFDWTRRNIRSTPAGWPVVDDHVLNIIIRGHGQAHQMADVFTTLSTFAGAPAFWRTLTPPDSEEPLVVSFARVESRWVMFDVANGIVVRNGEGDLASVEEIAADPHLLTRTAGTFQYLGVPYERYFYGFTPPTVPAVLRAERQMPWPRLIMELKEALGPGESAGREGHILWLVSMRRYRPDPEDPHGEQCGTPPPGQVKLPESGRC